MSLTGRRHYFGHHGCQQTKSDGYHFPSAQQRFIVQPAGPQAAVFSAPGVHAAEAFFLPLAMDSPAEPAIASAATAATSANFETILIIEQLPQVNTGCEGDLKRFSALHPPRSARRSRAAEIGCGRSSMNPN